MRVASKHNCSRHHRNATYFARCAWPGAAISGRGQLAIVISCPDARIVLVERLRWAQILLAEFNVFGCGPSCVGEHELVAVDHDGPTDHAAWALRAQRPSRQEPS